MAFIPVSRGVKMVVTDSSPAAFTKSGRRNTTPEKYDPEELRLFFETVDAISEDYERNLAKYNAQMQTPAGRKEATAERLRATWTAMEMKRLRDEGRRLGII